jgi:hypothetical protein
LDVADVTLDWFEANLEGFEWDEKRGTGEAYCPCHDDVGSSLKGLSIKKEMGKWLAFCHSCNATLPAVIEARNGISFSPSVRKAAPGRKGKKERGMTWWARKTGVPEEVWASLGCVEHGQGVEFTFATTEQSKVRMPPKEMFWTHEDLETPALWPYPEDELPQHVTLVEGESDCGTAHAGGLPYAYAVTKGAGSALPPGWAEAFHKRGVREITICGDADDAGQRFSQRAVAEALDAQLLVNVIRIDEIVDPFTGVADLNSLWRLCETKEEFLGAVSAALTRVSSEITTSSYEEMCEISKMEISWIVNELVSPGDKVLLSGPQKSFKTWIMLDLVRAIADGQAFLCEALYTGTSKRNVLIVEEEGSKQQFARRVRRMNLSPDHGRVEVMHREAFRFTEPDSMSRIIAICREKEIDCVFFDPLQRMMPGVNENDSAETGVVWDEIARLQQALPEIVCVVVHHANKTERLTWESTRGSSRHGGEVDLGIFCEKSLLDPARVRMRIDGRDVHLEMEEGWGFEGSVTITDDDFEIRVSQMQIEDILPAMKGKRNTEEIVKAVGEGHTTRQEIIDATGLSRTTVISKLKGLVEEGILKVVDTEIRGRVKYEIDTVESLEQSD